jgi:hypothetical protein
VGEIRRLPEKKPEPISEEQEEREYIEAQRGAPQKEAGTEEAPEVSGCPEAPIKKKHKPSRENEFYYCPSAWADRAYVVLISSEQLILAFRLYRRWKTKSENGGAIVCSNQALGFSHRNSTLRKSKDTMLRALKVAGLIWMEGGGNGRAPRVRILE